MKFHINSIRAVILTKHLPKRLMIAKKSLKEIFMKSKKILTTVLAFSAALSPMAFADIHDNHPITGGRQVPELDYAWQVKLIGTKTDNTQIVCGGALIADLWAVTSAKCFLDTSGNKLTMADFKTITLFSYDPLDSNGREISPMPKRKMQKKPVTHFIVHDQPEQNDIALVTVAKDSYQLNEIPPFLNGRQIKLMNDTENQTLSKLKEQNWVPQGERLPLFVVSGYQGDPSSTKQLKRDYLAAIPDNQCNNGGRNTHCVTTPESSYTQGLCNADIGAPLVWKNPDNASDRDKGLRLAGIASSKPDANCNSEFTNIAPYISWIQEQYRNDDRVIATNDVFRTGTEFKLNPNIALIYQFDSYDPLADENMPTYTSKGEVGGLADSTDVLDKEKEKEAADAAAKAEAEAKKGEDGGGSFGLGLLMTLGAVGFTRRKKQ